MKRVLVTGASGFVGSHLVELLAGQGYEVVATDVRPPGKLDLQGRVTFVASDLSRPETLHGLCESVQWVFHPAAVFDYSAPWEQLRRVNVEGTRLLCAQAVHHGVERMIVWSAAGVYDAAKLEATGGGEESPILPSNLYERSKWEQEKVARRFQQRYGLAVTLIRPAPIYGPRNRYGMGDMIMKLALLPLLPVPLSLDNRIVCVHVRDVARAALFLAQKKEAIGEVYNLVDDTDMTARELAFYLAQLLGIPAFPVYVPQKFVREGIRLAGLLSTLISLRLMKRRPFLEQAMADYVRFSYRFSNRKLKELGYEFLYPDAREGLKETIAWYAEQGWLKRSPPAA